MDLIEGAGVALAYADDGAGPTALVVHGLASDAAAWAPLADALAQTARVLRYDRRGYGGSGSPEPYAATTVEEQAEDAAALLRGLDAGPAVVVGDGFGALVALDLAKRHAALVRALVLAEPPLLMFAPAATEALAAERAQIEQAVRAGGPAAGVGAWLDARGADAAPGARERALGAHRAFFADYAGLATWPVTRASLRALAHDAVVVTRPDSAAVIVAAADALAALLPRAQRRRDGDLLAPARALLAAPPR